MGKIINLIYTVIVFSIGGILLIGCYMNNSYIIIKQPTELLAAPDWKDSSGNKVIAVLEQGEKGKVIHIRYSKNSKFYKIKLANGQKGYVMNKGNNLEIREGETRDM